MSAASPFFALVPAGDWTLALVILSSVATVIASQALISGAFSLTMQAIQLGYSPRLRVEHTSLHEKGQIYMPQINWALCVACIGLVIGFHSSANLAAAYGIAVSLTMIVTTILFYFAVRRVWNWQPATAMLICGGLTLLGYIVARPFTTLEKLGNNTLAIAVTLLLTGFFLMFNRRKAITQVLGLLTVENGVMLAAVALTTYGMPLVVELGIFFDVMVAVMVLGILVYRIRESFDSMDTSKLTQLRG